MDDGAKTIEDAEELAQVRRQARRVHLQSFLLAAIGTAMVYFIPT